MRFTSHDRIKQIESQVINRGTHRGLQTNALFCHRRRHVDVTRDGDAHRLVKAIGRNARFVVIALQEFIPVRQTLFLTAEHHAVDQGQFCITTLKQASGRISGFALTGIAFVVKVGVTRQLDPRIRVVVHHHVGAGAHRPGIDAHVAPAQCRLTIKLIDLPWHRCKKVHGQPVDELRVFPVKGNFQGAIIDGYCTLQRQWLQVDPYARLQGYASFDLIGQCLQALNMFTHHPENRRLHGGMRQPFDLIDVVLSLKQPRARIRQRHRASCALHGARLTAIQIHIARRAIGV